MSGRPQAQERPGFIKVCLCPEITVTSTGKINRRDLTRQCPTCRGFAALERCPDCEDRGALGSLGQRLRHGKLWLSRSFSDASPENPSSSFFSASSCETCRGRMFVRTDRKVDPYAQKKK